MTRATEATPAIKACRELIYGDGTDASLQRAIDLARAALGLDVRSILSENPDAFGFFYGFWSDPVTGRQDARRIDVQETPDGWNAYVGGDPVQTGIPRKAEAEALAIAYIREHPTTLTW
jgi:hypothetical protein